MPIPIGIPVIGVPPIVGVVDGVAVLVPALLHKGLQDYRLGTKHMKQRMTYIMKNHFL